MYFVSLQIRSFMRSCYLCVNVDMRFVINSLVEVVQEDSVAVCSGGAARGGSQDKSRCGEFPISRNAQCRRSAGMWSPQSSTVVIRDGV